MKLDRLIAKHRSLGRNEAHRLIAAGRVRVDAALVMGNQVEVDRFQQVQLDDEVVQAAERALYLMLHKPAGVVSARSATSSSSSATSGSLLTPTVSCAARTRPE